MLVNSILKFGVSDPAAQLQREMDMALIRSGSKAGAKIHVCFLTLNSFRGICHMGDEGECWAWEEGCRQEVSGAQIQPPCLGSPVRPWACDSTSCALVSLPVNRGIIIVLISKRCCGI